MNGFHEDILRADEVEQPKGSSTVALINAWLLRLMSLVFVGLTIFIWAQAVGFGERDLLRFDLLTSVQKSFTAVFCVLFPVAAVGLWTTLSWGRVVWFMAVAAQLLSYTVWNDLLGIPVAVLLLHAVGIAIYLILLGADRFIAKKE